MSNADHSTDRRGNRNGRTLGGVLSKPRQQLKYASIFLGIGIVGLGLILSVFLTMMTQTVETLGLMYAIDRDITEMIRQSLDSALYMTVAVAGTMALVALLLIIWIGHRIFGPVIPIKRQIEELKKGNYAARGALRKHDEFTDVMDALNELAEHLESGKQTTKAE